MSLFRVWSWDSNDRTEIAHFKADAFEEVQTYLLEHFIKEEGRDDVDKTNFGLEWMENDPDECAEQSEDRLCPICREEITLTGKTSDGRLIGSCKDAFTIEQWNDDYSPCDSCDGCTAGFEIEEVENPTDDEYEFKTIQGTNEYYDLTKRKVLEESLKQLKEQHDRLEKKWEADVEFCGPAAPNQSLNRCNANIATVEKLLATEVEKADDWDKTLSGAWKKSPEHGIAALLLSSATPQEALSDELIEKSKELLRGVKE